MEIFVFKDTVSDKYFCVNTYDITFYSVEEMETKGFKPRMKYSLDEAKHFVKWILDCMLSDDILPIRPNFYYGIDKENYNIVYVKLGEIKND